MLSLSFWSILIPNLGQPWAYTLPKSDEPQGEEIDRWQRTALWWIGKFSWLFHSLLLSSSCLTFPIYFLRMKELQGKVWMRYNHKIRTWRHSKEGREGIDWECSLPSLSVLCHPSLPLSPSLLFLTPHQLFSLYYYLLNWWGVKSNDRKVIMWESERVNEGNGSSLSPTFLSYLHLSLPFV